jgi:hypothetical protein
MIEADPTMVGSSVGLLRRREERPTQSKSELNGKSEDGADLAARKGKGVRAWANSIYERFMGQGILGDDQCSRRLLYHIGVLPKPG